MIGLHRERTQEIEDWPEPMFEPDESVEHAAVARYMAIRRVPDADIESRRKCVLFQLAKKTDYREEKKKAKNMARKLAFIDRQRFAKLARLGPADIADV